MPSEMPSTRVSTAPTIAPGEETLTTRLTGRTGGDTAVWRGTFGSVDMRRHLLLINPQPLTHGSASWTNPTLETVRPSPPIRRERNRHAPGWNRHDNTHLPPAANQRR